MNRRTNMKTFWVWMTAKILRRTGMWIVESSCQRKTCGQHTICCFLIQGAAQYRPSYTVSSHCQLLVPVQPRILQSGQCMNHYHLTWIFFHLFFSNLDTIKSTGLCFYFIGHGTCPYKPIVLNYMKQLCKNNLDRAVKLVTYVTKKESSLHAELLEDWGRSISSTVIWNFATVGICIVNSIGAGVLETTISNNIQRDDPIRRKETTQSKVGYADPALKSLVTLKVRCTADTCESSIV